LFEQAWRRISEKAIFEYVPVVLQVSDEGLDGSETPRANDQRLPMTSFTAQNIRSLGCAIPDTSLSMTSDIDMLPASAGFFDKISELALRTESFVVGRDVLPRGQVPICYNVASPAVWSQVVGLKSHGEMVGILEALWLEARSRGEYSGIHGGDGWHFDQEWLFERIESFELAGGEVHRLTDAHTGHARLDRSLRWPWLMRAKFRRVARGGFADFHIPLPVSRHMKLLQEFLLEI
jgi:hypothetical protein